MKKLIMCISAMLSACALNAATVNWSISDLFDDNYESLEGTITLTSGAVSSGAVAIDGGVASGSFDGTWGTDPFATGSAWTMTAKVKGDDGNFYEQVFNLSLGTIDAADDRANAAAFDTLIADGQSAMLPNTTLDITDLPSAGWSAAGSDVPEPTSGLLLLVGGAMLALRRKRA